MTNVYATPESDLGYKTTSERVGGSVEDAIAGNIEISMLGTMGEAWHCLQGFKFKCNIAFLFYYIIVLLAAFISLPIIFGLTAIGAGETTATAVGTVIQMIASFSTMTMFMGIHIMGMRHAENKTVSAGSVFAYFKKVPAILLCYIIMIIMIMLGFVLIGLTRNVFNDCLHVCDAAGGGKEYAGMAGPGNIP